MESALDDCLAQFSSKYVLKKEQRQAVLGDWSKSRTGCGRSTTSFGKMLIYQLFAAVKLKQREKNVVLVASPLRMLSMIKLKQWFFKSILYQNINYLLNCNYQLCANLLSNFAFTNTFNSGWDLTIKCNHITFIKLYCWL